MRRTATLTGLLALLFTLAAAPASAQDYPPDAPTAAVSDTTVAPGEPITITSEGWLPGSEVTITFESEPQVLATVQTGGDGAFTTQVTVPADATPGEHTLRLSGLDPDGQPRTVAIALTVPGAAGDDAAAGVTPSPRLPATGTDALLAVGAAVGLVGVGAAAVAVARRRSRAPAAG